MAKKNYYVVWLGSETGVFDNWKACDNATRGFSYAQYRGFTTLEEANRAFEMGFDDFQDSLIE